MQITIDLDPETYQAYEQQAQEQSKSADSLIATLLRRFAPVRKAPLPVNERVLTNAELAYQIPVSQGARSFSHAELAKMLEEDGL